MAEVQLKNIKKVYPFVSGEQKKSKKKKADEPEKKKVNLQITDEGVVAVQAFNLDIADKEFIVLVGPSGCGKSTTLRMVAGLEEISGGELYIDGKLMNDVAPKDRDIAMVFQNYALYPHMTVYENMAFSLKLRHALYPHMSVYDNMAFSLKLRKEPKDLIDKKVREAAEILDITQYLERKPKALSGGQRQRVAIGRAIVRAPKVMLMDEPLSNLDAKLRNEMRAEIIKLRERINTTFIYVTHDQTEAMTLGDRIVIMKDGYIQQIGTPQEVFNHPANLFVAGFIGMPVMNFFDAELKREGSKYFVELSGVKVELDKEKTARLLANDVQSQPVTLGVRPEHTDVADKGIHRRGRGDDGLQRAPASECRRQGRHRDRSHHRHEGQLQAGRHRVLLLQGQRGSRVQQGDRQKPRVLIRLHSLIIRQKRKGENLYGFCKNLSGAGEETGRRMV